MICDEVRRMLGAYVDKELELTRQPDLEKHLAGCPSCQAAAEEINNFSSLIRMNILVYKAPGELKAKIQASLRRESRPSLVSLSGDGAISVVGLGRCRMNRARVAKVTSARRSCARSSIRLLGHRRAVRAGLAARWLAS
jgi:anti-sigma factor RsiW